MARPQRRQPVRAADVHGMKYFRLLVPLLERLHDVGTARDKAGNRLLFFDQYTILLLLYFFSPVITSLRGLQQASDLDKVQRLFGMRGVSLGSLSEATGVFDAVALEQIVHELAQRAVPLEHGAAAEALRDLTAVDGTILSALPKMVWALWKDPQDRAVKMHLHFEVFKGVPCRAKITPAACSEPAHLQAMLEPGRLYVLDRGYASYELFQHILDTGSSFVCRVQDNTAFGLKDNRPLTDLDRAAGVIRDALLFRLGARSNPNRFDHLLRLVIVRRIKPDHTVEEIWLLTDRLDLSAELIALAYRYRWTVELFFRWFKCILGCRHRIEANSSRLQKLLQLVVDERPVVDLVLDQVEENSADGVLGLAGIETFLLQHAFGIPLHKRDGRGVGFVKGRAHGAQISGRVRGPFFFCQSAGPFLDPGQHPGLGPGQVNQVLEDRPGSRVDGIVELCGRELTAAVEDSLAGLGHLVEHLQNVGTAFESWVHGLSFLRHHEVA
jgi:hypothetical protein